MENARPTFLTVLCILTFIGSAWGIFGAISNFTSAGQASSLTQDVLGSVQDEIENSTETEEEAAIAGKILDNVSGNLTEENIKNAAIASGIASILSLVGAILMWGLNKKGYWIYLIGLAVSIIAPMVIYKGFTGVMASGMTAFFGVIFAVLYGLNLKHMR